MYLRGRVDGNKFFECGNYTLNKKCFSHFVKDTDVNDYVLRVIRTHINVYTENVDMVRRLNQRQEASKNMMFLTERSESAEESWKACKAPGTVI